MEDTGKDGKKKRSEGKTTYLRKSGKGERDVEEKKKVKMKSI